MAKIYYIIGKSASGKDSIYQHLLQDPRIRMKRIIMYTTRPIRSEETQGEEYFFIDEKKLEEFREAGKVIECRTYQTMHGPWNYATIQDGQIDLDSSEDYLALGDFNSYLSMREYFGEDVICPIYIEVEDGERLMRALLRERSQAAPKYAEMCRRFLSDREQFAEEKLIRAGIRKRYINDDFDRCLAEVRAAIQDGKKA